MMIHQSSNIAWILLFLGAAFLFFLDPSKALAHKMIIETENNDEIHVRYDDGTPAVLAIVTLYDENGETLLEEQVDENGQLLYDSNLSVYRVIADDGMGHRASYVNDGSQTSEESVPILIRALLGIAILLFIAAIFYYRIKSNEVGK